MTYLKSPLNYTGGKFKLLPQILPLFPKDIKYFADLFGGGANVLANVEADYYLYNDWNSRVASIIGWMAQNDTSWLLDKVENLIAEYSLTKENQEGYLQLRHEYNHGKYKWDTTALYVLICYSFNNQIRFNSKGEYNMPFGKDRSSFNPTLRGKFITFASHLHALWLKGEIDIISEDYGRISKFNPDYFIYCDPPYLISTATYNENDGWTKLQEIELLEFLTEIDQKGVRFALSNVLEHGGKENTILKKFADKFTVHELDMNYSNASYQKKDKTSKSREVLIVNY